MLNTSHLTGDLCTVRPSLCLITQQKETERDMKKKKIDGKVAQMKSQLFLLDSNEIRGVSSRVSEFLTPCSKTPQSAIKTHRSQYERRHFSSISYRNYLRCIITYKSTKLCVIHVLLCLRNFRTWELIWDSWAIKEQNNLSLDIKGKTSIEWKHLQMWSQKFSTMSQIVLRFCLKSKTIRTQTFLIKSPMVWPGNSIKLWKKIYL